ncbi:PhoD-like phosphatase N-terminal domain-containing protein, partial [Streptosporangium algeriense]
MEQTPSRRVFLSVAATGVGGLLLTGAGLAPTGNRTTSRTLRRDPFTLGIASGDPSPDGVVLWTRLAPDPLGPQGLGGMPARDVEVEWQVAADEDFTRVLRGGVATARRERAHSVHVELDGLEPGREYFYRFRAEGEAANRSAATAALQRPGFRDSPDLFSV